MTQEQPANPLHGLTLETILNQLVERYGWEELADRININCFRSDPSIKSSLKFLRKTDWARTKVLKVKVPEPALVTIVSVLMTPEISESVLVVVTDSVPIFATAPFISTVPAPALIVKLCSSLDEP